MIGIDTSSAAHRPVGTPHLARIARADGLGGERQKFHGRGQPAGAGATDGSGLF
jgi:hypothetical protein